MTVDRDGGVPIVPAAARNVLLETLAASGTGTWWWDAGTGQVHWDPTLERLCGLEPGTFGSTYEAWLATLHPDEVESILAEVQRAIDDRSSYHFEHSTTWPDGTVRWLECRGQVTVDADGNFTGTVGCAVDVTDRRHTDEQRAAAFEYERWLRDRLELLFRVTSKAVGAEDHREFMRAAAAATVPTLGDWCSIHYIADTGSDLEVEVVHSDPGKVAWAAEIARNFPYRIDAEMGVAAVIRSGQTELVEQISDDVIQAAVAGSDIDPDAARELIDSLGLTSAITVPLVTSRGVRGAMQFVSAESGRVYDGADVALAEVAVRHIAEALDNIWLTQRDRQISATLQRALLPPRVPAVPGIDVAVAYWPAGVSVEAGGDFYDVFATSPTSWSVVIGDVCGTGPDAAAVTGIARHTVRAAARHGQNHQNTLEWLNEAMRLSDRDRFCTAVYATVEALDHRWRLTSCAAGHPRPIHSTADGQAHLVGEHGSLLGVLDTLTLHPAQMTLAVGDVVVLYTDGFTDLPPPHDRTEADMVELVAKLAATSDSADEIVTGMYRSMTERLPPAQAADDMALVVLRITDLP